MCTFAFKRVSVNRGGKGGRGGHPVKILIVGGAFGPF